MSRVFLSAAHKSSGKTTLAIGLCAAFRERGLEVQPFKKGPDYIDPAWLGLAAGRPCYNLDFFIAGTQETVDEFCHQGADADLSLVEGNKGLYDGVDLDGDNSNAALAKAIDSPVVLVIDVRGTMRGIAPLLIGYRVFDEAVDIAGVIANMSGGARHESKLRAAVEEYTDIPFLGALGNDAGLVIDERHLGLVPGYEDPQARQKIARIAGAVRQHVDLERILELAGRAAPIEPSGPPPSRDGGFEGLRIGIAMDRAFGFYYPGDLEAFRRAGAQLLPIDTLGDSRLPEIDGLLIGGGFPERHAAALAANAGLRESIRAAIEAGLPTYAECGGLMYLSRRLDWNHASHDMVGVLPAVTRMHDKPRGRGYVILEPGEAQHPWLAAGQAPQSLRAHEFHYSSLDGLPEDCDFAYRVERGSGIARHCDGLVRGNLLASYSHLRNTSANPWVNRFLGFVAYHKQAAPGAAGAA
jgi:cobyrinic acid a,c-diamide synthase